MERIRVASLQYYVRPVKSFDEFRDQVDGLVGTAEDYKCQLVVFPEYFTVQLLTLGNVKRPIADQVRALSDQTDRFVELMAGLARKYRIHIAAGTIPGRGEHDTIIHNDCYFFGPGGDYAQQGKLHMTRFEKEEWLVSPRRRLRIIETVFGRIAINICYDVEFPELARSAAKHGAHILIVPSCTDERQGFLRVRYCAHARSIENQMYVIQSSTVGSLPMVPAVSLNYGQASILTPSDFPFSRDGILAEGIPNQETMVIGELNLGTLHLSRASGTVLPLLDSRNSDQIASETEIVTLK